LVINELQTIVIRIIKIPNRITVWERMINGRLSVRIYGTKKRIEMIRVFTWFSFGSVIKPLPTPSARRGRWLFFYQFIIGCIAILVYQLKQINAFGAMQLMVYVLHAIQLLGVHQGAHRIVNVKRGII
jgi:hypothetical protein